MQKLAILGGGSWGAALASVLGAGAGSLSVWARDPRLVAEFLQTRQNRRYLPDVVLPERVSMTSDIAEALSGASLVIWAVPSGAFREVAQEAAPHIDPKTLLLSATKGLEERSGARMSQILAEVFPKSEDRAAVLTGPNLALEIARGAPAASVVASSHPETARAIQQVFAQIPNSYFRVYMGRDVVGAELGGAVKNVIAIGAGVCDGLGFGDNSKAALLTRGLAEIMRLGVALGAEPSTFLGLSGVGDLFATANSRLSRNYRVGQGLGRGRKLDEILMELGQVAEGVPTTHVVCDLAAKQGVEMPICLALREALFAHRPAQDLIRELMLRPPKEETA